MLRWVALQSWATAAWPHGSYVQGLKPLAHAIAEVGLVLGTRDSWGEADARALGAVFSDHALKHLHLCGTVHSGFTCPMGQFLPALATALPALKSLSLSYAYIPKGESLKCVLKWRLLAWPCLIQHKALSGQQYALLMRLAP